MKIHRASRRIRWAVPAGVVIALAIAIPSGASLAGSHRGDNHGGLNSTAHHGNSGDSGNSGDRNFTPASSTPPYLHVVATIPFPAPFTLGSYDISWVDATTHAYYLADRTNKGVDAVNTLTNTFGNVIGAGEFSGASPTVTPAQTTACGTAETGPNGVLSLTVGGSNQVWAADGVTATQPVSNVKVFTLTSSTTGTLAATIPTADSTFGTTGTCHTDEVAYDAADHIFIVANNRDNPPYMTLISVNANPSTDKIVGQVKLLNATNGVEQPVWDPENDMFFVNIPGAGLAKINPKTSTLVTTYSEPNCTSSGLALDPRNQTLLSACGINPDGSMLLSARTGAVLARFPQVSGSDENWYDPGTDLFYLGANHMTVDGTATGVPTPVVGVIGAGDEGRHGSEGARWLSNFATGAATTNTHSVAADPSNGELFVPFAGTGIVVLRDSPAPTGL